MSTSTNSWIWDSRRQDYYRAEWNVRKGAYDYIWNNPSTASAPRTATTPAAFNQTYPSTSGPIAPAQPPVQPLDGGYGARIAQPRNSNTSRGGYYGISQPFTQDPNTLAQSFAELSTTDHGTYSHSLAPPPRSSSISQASTFREPTNSYGPRPGGYSTSQAPTYRPGVSLGSTLGSHAESSRAAERRVAPGYGAMSPPANSIDRVPSFEYEVRSSGSYPNLGGGTARTSRHGSSHETQIARGTYPSHASTAADSVERSTQPDAYGSKAKLDPDEFYVRSRPQNFFVEGKVFIKLHTEDAGGTSDRSSFGFSTVAYEELAFSQLRRFVVVKARPKEHYCLCVPITTYSGRGTTKKNVDKDKHTIIYTGKSVPPKLAGEEGMNKSPLHVNLTRGDDKLDPRSRINLGKTYPVEWNTKVKEIGCLDKSSMVKLTSYWKSLMDT